MTIKTVKQTTEQYGTAAERADIRTSDIAEGHRIIFRETDTDAIYEFFGTAWVQTHSGGAALVNIVNREIDVARLQDYDRFTIAANGSVDTWDISWADEVRVSVSRTSGVTDSIAVYASVDGVNFDPVAVNDVTGASVSGVTAAVHTIPFNSRKLRFTHSGGGTDPIVVSWSARNSKRGI